ncbi:MAG: hypothetical protein HPZ00_06275 [Christensenellaceae bacterium]|nr:hypothetical protein [Christensenellaceae bacterium]DAS00375.1 MAG TPA: hypothetical protein [Bacteriophage sp.]
MRRRRIPIALSVNKLAASVKELKDYQKLAQAKMDTLRQRAADRLADEVRRGFSGAVVDDLISGGRRFADVQVWVSYRPDAALVIAWGTDAIWVEFGAGVYHNGAGGSSPHPKGTELGFTIGGYGKGQGNKETWGFYEKGELYLTRGTPAAAPMYSAAGEIAGIIADTVREVFGS